MNRIKRAWPWGALGVAAAVVVVLAVARPWRGAGAPDEGAAVEAGAGKEALPPPAPPAPLLHPEDVKWLSDATYVDGGGRMVSRYDSDGDGLADADELLLYGTLRYDARTRADAPRIDLKPAGSRVFHSTRTPDVLVTTATTAVWPKVE